MDRLPKYYDYHTPTRDKRIDGDDSGDDDVEDVDDVDDDIMVIVHPGKISI